MTNEVVVFLEEDVQHGLADQLGRRVAQLCGAKRIHVEHRSGRIDHEVHDRIVLEHLAPLLHGVTQIGVLPRGVSDRGPVLLAVAE
ncbi:hypothetical protein ABH979_004486 [Bradyrhizobium ottawaense]